MAKKKGTGKKQAATARVDSSLLPTFMLIDSARRAVEIFKRAIRFHEKLVYVLDRNRVMALQALLQAIVPPVSPAVHTELLKIACDYNDPDVIRVLVRANQFQSEKLNGLEGMKLLDPLTAGFA